MKKKFKVAIMLVTLAMLLTGCGAGDTSTTPTEEQPYLGEWHWEEVDPDGPTYDVYSADVILSKNMTFTAEGCVTDEQGTEIEKVSFSGKYKVVGLWGEDELKEFDGEIVDVCYDEVNETLHANLFVGEIIELIRPA